MLMKLVLGDWSDDGHGKSREVVYDVNHTLEDVQEAYKQSCKTTGVSFNHNDDFTGVERKYPEDKLYRICTDYEDSYISEEAFNELRKYIDEDTLYKYIGEPDEDGDRWVDDFEGLWWEFVKISLPDLCYKEEKNKIPAINGWWGDLNVQFGYGLFS